MPCLPNDTAFETKDMTEALRDPIWQFVGVIISLVALAVAIAAVRSQLLRKSIAYFYAHERPVFYLFNPELEERLKITLDGREVEKLSTFSLHIFNNGNIAVPPSDFVVPIAIAFPADSRIFGVSVTEASPANLAVSITGIDQQFVIAPLLLNPGDEFTVQFLVERTDDSSPLEPVVNARIAGVKDFTLRRPTNASRQVRYWPYRSRILFPLLLGLVVGTFGNFAFDIVLALLRRLSGGT